jgi:type III restriction enzyme
LNAVAITDHHDLTFVSYIREAAEQETNPEGQTLPEGERLVVFPGVELTLGVPCQALLILDADFPNDRLSMVLEALAINIVDPAAPSLPSVERRDHIDSLSKLCTTLNEREWLRNRYIVLPNVTDGGLGTLIRKSMQSKYKEMPSVGGYLDGSFAKLGDGVRTIVSGRDSAWGNKRIALFQTSDSRSSTFESLGKHSTWVKWATPTAEALRQACLAQESRISQIPPATPMVSLTRLSVSNSKFMGPIELELNTQYNAIIGGRGTGKSTILEYLRWVLCDERSTESNDEVSDHAVRQQRLISETLRPLNALVEAHFLINGLPHIVRRNAGPSGDLQLKVGDGTFEKLTDADVRALLPVHAYSQKQLSSVAVRTEELTRFVTAPILAQLNAIDARIDDLSGRIRQNYATLLRARQLSTAIARNALTVESLAKQAETVRDSLEAVTDEDREIIVMKPSFDSADSVAVSWSRKLDQASEAAHAFLETVDGVLESLSGAPGENPFTTKLRPIEQEVRSVLKGVRTHAAAAVGAVTASRATGSKYSTQVGNWHAECERYRDRYTSAKEASNAHASQLAELTRLEQQQKETAATLTQQQEEREQLGDPAAAHAALRGEWLALLKERSDCMRDQCDRLSDLSEGLLRARLHQGRGVTGMATHLRGVAAGAGIKGAKFDDLVSKIRETQQDPLELWEAVLAKMELGVDENLRGDPHTESVVVLRAYGLTDNEANKFLARLTPDKWLDLALTPIKDSPRFRYQTREGEYIDFESASAGQQATALLKVLLNQDGPSLIIDQPEDDLDSQVIEEVVVKLWEAKTKRQLIFASHNANLVVNGDAELVVCCDYRMMGEQSGGNVKLLGAIDVRDVRQEITSVMEGGEKAFRLRKEKYGF